MKTHAKTSMGVHCGRKNAALSENHWPLVTCKNCLRHNPYKRNPHSPADWLFWQWTKSTIET